MSDARDYDSNPYEGVCEDRAFLWKMLLFDDIEAFIRCDWRRHSEDFLADAFFAVNANRSAAPEDWSPDFPTLDAYRENWLGFAARSAARADPETLRRAHFAASRLVQIRITGDLAVCVKKFDGSVTYRDGSSERLDWRSVYLCRRAGSRWFVASIVGFLPAV
ncbi:MAG: hypothetical protein MPJ52_01805 [Alphaproteobacteria bacterium]|nr:hypothetical protein [Alphaproteobacteria bacterium]